MAQVFGQGEPYLAPGNTEVVFPPLQRPPSRFDLELQPGYDARQPGYDAYAYAWAFTESIGGARKSAEPQEPVFVIDTPADSPPAAPPDPAEVNIYIHISIAYFIITSSHQFHVLPSPLYYKVSYSMENPSRSCQQSFVNKIQTIWHTATD